MKLIFRAFDGKDFETELECKAYEIGLGRGTIHGYNETEYVYVVLVHGDEVPLEVYGTFTTESVAKEYATHLARSLYGMYSEYVVECHKTRVTNDIRNYSTRVVSMIEIR